MYLDILCSNILTSFFLSKVLKLHLWSKLHLRLVRIYYICKKKNSSWRGWGRYKSHLPDQSIFAQIPVQSPFNFFFIPSPSPNTAAILFKFTHDRETKQFEATMHPTTQSEKCSEQLTGTERNLFDQDVLFKLYRPL